MKAVTILFLLLLITPAYGQLTKEDLQTLKEDLRTIIKEEIAASEKRTREYINLKIETVNTRIDGAEKNLNARIDGVEKNLNARIDDVRIMMIALIGLIAAAIAIPQIIIAYKERGQKEMQRQQEAMQTQIDQLQERLAVLDLPPS